MNIGSLHSRHLSILLATGIISACGSDSRRISSNQVNTHEIFATFQAVSDGGKQVFAEAQLTHQNPPGYSSSERLYISLTDNDRLWISTGEHFSEVQLGNDIFRGLEQVNATQSEFNNIRDVRYSFLLGRVSTQGSRYAARLNRNETDEYRIAMARDHHTDAPASWVTLPLDFTLHAPMAGDSYSRNNDVIQIDWAPTESNTSVTLQVKTSCPGIVDAWGLYTLELQEDTGRITLDAGTLSAEGMEGNCSSTFSLVRSRLGVLDSAFTGGYVAGHQIRTLSINTTD